MILDLHLSQDSRPIVGHGDIAVGRNQDLVEAAGSEGGLDDAGHRPRCENVLLDGIGAVYSSLLALIPDDDEGSAGLVFGYLG